MASINFIRLLQFFIVIFVVVVLFLFLSHTLLFLAWIRRVSHNITDRVYCSKIRKDTERKESNNNNNNKSNENKMWIVIIDISNIMKQRIVHIWECVVVFAMRWVLNNYKSEDLPMRWEMHSECWACRTNKSAKILEMNVETSLKQKSAKILYIHTCVCVCMRLYDVFVSYILS